MNMLISSCRDACKMINPVLDRASVKVCGLDWTMWLKKLILGLFCTNYEFKKSLFLST